MTPRPTPAAPSRLRVLRPGGIHAGDFAADVRAGLLAEPKRLPCVWFYDEQGSRLFDEICDLDEYYPTRAEAAILRRHAREMVAALPAGVRLVELGSGTARKTRYVIEALLDRQESLHYLPIDVSGEVLEESSRQLLEAHPRLRVTAIEAEYEGGLVALPERGRTASLVLWLGSNVGNFPRDEAAAFLARVHGILGRDDRLLLGVDLRKEREVLEAAYDDAAGVTARFNRNVLVRMARELGAEVDPESFLHRAVWHAEEGRVAMYLVSRVAQTVRIPALDLEVEFEAGEAIHTEDSYKSSPEEIDRLAAAAGFEVVGRWYDERRRFTDVMLAP